MSTRVVIITTAPQTLRTFFLQQIQDLRDEGFDVHAICSPGLGMEPGSSFHTVAMNRSISPFADCVAIWRLTRLLRAIRPSIVHTHTPKAGLLGMIAAFAVGIPIRLYTVNGLVWEKLTGRKRSLLRTADKLAAGFATRVICVSNSLMRMVIAEGISSRSKTAVLGRGGSHGIDLRRFNPQRFSAEDRRHRREMHGLTPSHIVIGFVGRFVHDKGFHTLVEAWLQVRDSLPHATLLLAGERELSHPIPESLWAQVANDPRVIVVKALPDGMPEIFSVLDMLILPTLREGLPNVLLEAGAMEVPVIASDATGCVDVVVDGETGILFEIGSAEQLTAAVLKLAAGADLRRRLGKAARKHVAASFSESRVSALLADEYRLLLSST